jgi:hypothetical protein
LRRALKSFPWAPELDIPMDAERFTLAAGRVIGFSTDFLKVCGFFYNFIFVTEANCSKLIACDSIQRISVAEACFEEC